VASVVSDNGGSVGAAPIHLWAKLIPDGVFYADYDGYGYGSGYGDGVGDGYGDGNGSGLSYGYDTGGYYGDGEGYGNGEGDGGSNA
jgi:hypothetical protein